MEKEFDNIVYHGSSIFSEILIPHQAYDWGYEEGCENAVYATSNRNLAISFALGIIPDCNGECERIMERELGEKMVFVKGTPNYGGVGYLYMLPKEEFAYSRGTQWVCKQVVKPLEILKISVDDYLHLMRFPTEEERIIFENEERLSEQI